ncbi:hypothetical protein PHAVU_002G125801 [Phaseolus vulgaris]|uniref:Uncharacterized protein n=1 Tax=Phaseolus vulgaris TaxID=3885 RepID=V7CL78_PHAVU|nr:hypothetical protein PHAVU_002G125800g [Phaseolus vulgaris]ESW30113.1 hypothetical protein PHAVU_002G125800g [Phaseolus vulgaris]
MAIAAKTRFPLLACILKLRNFGSNLCCYRLHALTISDSVKRTQDDKHCNSLCLNHPCGKGGRCKVFGHKNPSHFCHCFC